MLNITSLVHPAMIAKIRKGITLAAKGKGHEMGGHGNRVYIANRKGHNIMRIDWKGQGKFVAYGGADWGRTDITDIVKEALQRGCSANRVKPRQFSCDAVSPSVKARLMRLAALLCFMLVIVPPITPAMADKPPTPLEAACIKQPYLVVCDWAFGPEKNP